MKDTFHGEIAPLGEGFFPNSVFSSDAKALIRKVNRKKGEKKNWVMANRFSLRKFKVAHKLKKVCTRL